MSESISDLKNKLAQLEGSKRALFLAELAQDSRKGAQQLVLRAQKEGAKKQLALEKQKERLSFERDLKKVGYHHIAGIDEVGRGPLAGPVVAAAVILPENFSVLGINDSKQLSEKKRNQLYDAIQREAVAIGIGIIDQHVIDEVNIYQASKLAMQQAVENLKIQPDYLLIDAMQLPIEIPQKSLIKGDARSLSIGASSIIAKVTRDKMMADYDVLYPGYDFAHNAGYGTPKHLAGLKALGITPIHRRTFTPVKDYI